MKEEALVVKVEKDVSSVRIDKKQECDKCGMCLFPKGASHIEKQAKNPIGAIEGDKVIIESEKDLKLLGASLVFGVPLVLIILSMVIVLNLVKSELIALATALVSVTVWFIILALIDKKLKGKVKTMPTIIQIIKEEKED